MMRILMIALDGATLDLLEPWMNEGKLPLLARLFREGTGGVLTSTVPWATPTAFASFATGTNPGKHGIYDFGVLKGEDYTSFTPTNGGNVYGRTLWRLLSDAGLRSLVINMPMTYPAERIEGAIVSGIPYPGGSERLSYPADLLDDLRRKGWDLARNASDDLAGNFAEYYEGMLGLVKNRGEAAAWLIQKQQPDFTAVHFLETDQVQHRFWQFMPGEPRYDPNGPHTEAILKLFGQVEKALALIIAAAGKDVILCLMSDHGFGPTRHQVWLNNWLVQNDYLVLKPTAGVKLKKAIYRLGLSPAAIRERAPERLKLAILRFFEQQKGRAIAAEMEQESGSVRSKGITDRLTEHLALDFYDVDWSRSRAFSTGTTAVGYVYLNLAGRDPQGIVSAGDDYARLRAEIISNLEQWAPVGQVQTPESLWHGPQLERAPDIIVRWASPTTDARYFQTRVSSHHLIKAVPNDYASHRLEGLYLMHGAGVAAGARVDADILDLAPTFLWLLSQPVPGYMDGRVLEDVVRLDRDVEYRDMAIAEAERSTNALSPEEELAIEESLRNLGYLE
jgi:predicted AlkP superfamily phosphohydrolase/phosphomutase